MTFVQLQFEQFGRKSFANDCNFKNEKEKLFKTIHRHVKVMRTSFEVYNTSNIGYLKREDVSRG